MTTLFRCLIATCVLASSAWAADSCEVNCENTVKMCVNTCKQLKNQGQGDKVSFCQSKCKEFENVCKDNCKKPKNKR